MKSTKTLYTVTTLHTRGDGVTEESETSVIDTKSNLGNRALSNRIEHEHGWRPESIVRVQRAVLLSHTNYFGY
jgi:hypothetical protein